MIYVRKDWTDEHRQVLNYLKSIPSYPTSSLPGKSKKLPSKSSFCALTVKNGFTLIKPHHFVSGLLETAVIILVE